MGSTATRLGVSAALVAGQWIKGDVALEGNRLVSIGLAPAVGSKVVVSGFVDHQINGFAGVDFRTADESEYARACEALLATGVTRFNPTLYSSSIDQYCDALGVLAQVHRRPPSGAWALGAHLEGPFLSRVWKGAHDPELLVDPNPLVVERLLRAGPVDLITVAPELPGAMDLIADLVAEGVRVSIGHSDASASQCREAVDAGASMITHVFNAHRRFAPRDPGPAAVALTDDRVSVGVIADGVHLDVDTLRLIARSTSDRMVLVTDAIAPAGLASVSWADRWERREGDERRVAYRESASEWESAPARVTVIDGAARLNDGTLAGSVATMDACVRRMIGLGVSSKVVLNAAGANRLRLGRSVDFVVLDDQWQVLDAYPEEHSTPVS